MAEHLNHPTPEDLSRFAIEDSGDFLQQKLTEHLAECELCQEAVREIRRLKTELKCQSPDVVVMDMDKQLRLIHEKANQPAQAWRIPAKMALTAASLLLVLAGAIFWQLYNKQGKSFDSSLVWLLNAQEENGSWTPSKFGGRDQFSVGLSSLAMLPLMQAKVGGLDMHQLRFEQYLLSQQSEDGLFGAAFSGEMYNHVLALSALLQLDKAHKGIAVARERAVSFLLGRQNDDGGWAYRPGLSSNAPVTGWCPMVLLQAKAAGLLPDADSALRGIRWLERGVGAPFPYDSPIHDRQPASAVSAMLRVCQLQAHGMGLLTTMPHQKDEKSAMTFSSDNLVLALFTSKQMMLDHRTGEFTSQQPLRQELLEQCEKSGVFAGTWNPTGPWGSIAGRLGATSLALQTLLTLGS